MLIRLKWKGLKVERNMKTKHYQILLLTSFGKQDLSVQLKRNIDNYNVLCAEWVFSIATIIFT